MSALEIKELILKLDYDKLFNDNIHIVLNYERILDNYMVYYTYTLYLFAEGRPFGYYGGKSRTITLPKNESDIEVFDRLQMYFKHLSKIDGEPTDTIKSHINTMVHMNNVYKNLKNKSGIKCFNTQEEINQKYDNTNPCSIL